MERYTSNQNPYAKTTNFSGLYFWLGDLGLNTALARWAVFFGEDYNNSSGIDKEEFIKKTNQCLDYIRHYCQDCQLYYKPHPAETNEQEFLDLSGFEVLKNASTSEIFLWKNIRNIKHTFSVFSTSSLSAYRLGFNSHVFYQFCRSVFQNQIRRQATEAWFKNMPDSFFIKDLDQELLENKILPLENLELKKEWSRMLKANTGQIWMLVTNSSYAAALISIANLLKELDPLRPINLVVIHHHRWDIVDLSEIKKFFGRVLILPRIFYSLRPPRLFKAAKTALEIRKMNLAQEDIIISFSSNAEFTENCFLSYFKKNIKIGFLPGILEGLYPQTGYPSILDQDNGFEFTKASWFYNKIFEPLLGLHRTVFKQPRDGQMENILKFQKPITEIYDCVNFF